MPILTIYEWGDSMGGTSVRTAANKAITGAAAGEPDDRPYLARRLSFVDASGKIIKITDEKLLDRSEPLVILGQPGMGKTTLMARLGEAPGARFVSARKLLRAPDPSRLVGPATRLIIDAIDEVPASSEGDAVDRILRQLALAGHPPFVLSCRLADWRSATAKIGIEEDYGATPIELQIEPLSRDEAEQFLSHSLEPERAAAVADHFSTLGPEDLLGNPQTLIMIEAVAGNDDLPQCRGELYDRAAAELRREHRSEKQDTRLATLSEEEALDAVGAAAAMIILAGKDAISNKAPGAVRPSDIHLGEIARLPGGADIGAVLGSRLFTGSAEGRFTLIHRTVAEHLGARWLARYADTDRKRRRLISLVQRDGKVPESLRGLHAWLARDPRLAPAVMAADPFGLVVNGDADRLMVAEGKSLLAALAALEDNNPGFRRDWRTHSLKGVVRPELLDEIRAIVEQRGSGYAVRTLILDALAGAPLASDLTEELRAIVLDVKEDTGIRRRAAEALLGVATYDRRFWPDLVEALGKQRNKESGRLGVDLLQRVGFERFTDEEIATAVYNHISKPDRTYVTGRLTAFERDLPTARLDGVITLLSARAARAREAKEEGHKSEDLTEMVLTLLARRLELGCFEPGQIWTWLNPFDAELGYVRHGADLVRNWMQAHDHERRALQRLVLLDAPGDQPPFPRLIRLQRSIPGIWPSDDDAIELLASFGAPARSTPGEVLRWKDVLAMVRHTPDAGAAVRAAARRFAGSRKGLHQFLDNLGSGRPRPWERRQTARRAKADRKLKASYEQARRQYRAREEDLRAGVFGLVRTPATVYLDLCYDVKSGDGPIARLDTWLGEDLRYAALDGFESFLTTSRTPTARQFAQSRANGRYFEAQWVIAAGAAERMRSGMGFADLSDERLLRISLVLETSQIASQAKIEGLPEAVAAEVRTRPGLIERYWRTLIEPQLRKRLDHVSGFYRLFEHADDQAIATDLAIEWLERFPALPAALEGELIDQLTGAGRFDDLRRVHAERSSSRWRSDDHRRNWQAGSFIFDFPAASAKLLDIGRRDPPIFWTMRHAIGAERGYNNPKHHALSPAQIEWLVHEFRSNWSLVHRPSGMSSGDTNPWDASEFISGLITRLGDDASDEAIAALAALVDAPADSFTPMMRTVAAEQAAKRVELDYAPPAIDTVMTVVFDAPPTTVADLQSVMIEELADVQRKLNGHPLDWRKGFFEGITPKNEEACRDEILKMIGEYPLGILCAPEGHLADDKRADIQCTIGHLMLPIEVKGQWHADLWSAADTQLDRRYAPDYRAEGRGIYLVLWFGKDVPAGKRLKGQGRGAKRPASPADLADALRLTLPADLCERIEIVVLDLTDPSTR